MDELHARIERTKNKRLIEKVGSFAEKFPELLDEWDLDNNEISPFEVSPHSGKKVWWKCKKGHSWHASICDRTSNRKHGCPYCSGRYVIPGENDLSTIVPQVAEEWHDDKNFPLRASDVKSMSNKRVWWKCCNGHEWQAAICSRVGSGGHNCPICTREQRVSFAECAIFYYFNLVDNSVIHTYTELGFELDVYIPSKRVAIEYDGATWHTEIKRDKRKNEKCKLNNIELYRLREYPLESLNDSSMDIVVNDETLSDVIKELIFKLYGINYDVNVLRDKQIIDSLKWRAPKEHSLAVKRPDLVDEFDVDKNAGLTADDVYYNSNKLYWWTCKNGHSYEMIMYDRLHTKMCPYCSGSRGRKIKNLDTGEIFDTLKAAAASSVKATSSSIYNCCNGKLKTTGGYRWGYVYEDDEWTKRLRKEGLIDDKT